MVKLISLYSSSTIYQFRYRPRVKRLECNMQFNKDKMQAKHFLQKVMLGSYIVPHRIWQTMNMNMNSVSA